MADTLDLKSNPTKGIGSSPMMGKVSVGYNLTGKISVLQIENIGSSPISSRNQLAER